MTAPDRFRIKVYRHGKEILVAAADPPLVGRTFTQGELRLEVKEGFYGTEEGDERTLLSELRACTIANLVGSGVVSVAVREGLVDPLCVLEIGGVPHAQIAVLQ